MCLCPVCCLCCLHAFSPALSCSFMGACDVKATCTSASASVFLSSNQCNNCKISHNHIQPRSQFFCCRSMYMCKFCFLNCTDLLHAGLQAQHSVMHLLLAASGPSGLLAPGACALHRPGPPCRPCPGKRVITSYQYVFMLDLYASLRNARFDCCCQVLFEVGHY